MLSEIQNTNDSTKMRKILQSNTNGQSHNCPIDSNLLFHKFQNNRSNFKCDYFNDCNEENIDKFIKGHFISDIISDFMNKHFTESEIINAVKQMKCKKACGSDGI